MKNILSKKTIIVFTISLLLFSTPAGMHAKLYKKAPFDTSYFAKASKGYSGQAQKEPFTPYTHLKELAHTAVDAGKAGIVFYVTLFCIYKTFDWSAFTEN